jgi:hypothetical protein
MSKRIALALALAACSSAKSSDHSIITNKPAPAPAAVEKADKNLFAGEAKQTVDFERTKESAGGRKVIRTGRIELLVAGYDDARAKIDALVKGAGGYVDSTNITRRQDQISDGTIVVRLPKTAFGELVPKLKEIGEVLSESTNANDITDEYVDMSARLASAQTLEKRLLELASDKHGNIDQVLSVERELARVRGEIEGYEGHIRQWNDQVAMSTLTLSIQTKRPEIIAAPAHVATLGERTSHAFGQSIGAMKDAGMWLVVNGIAFLPWLLFAVPGVVLGRKILRRFWKRLPEARVVP